MYSLNVRISIQNVLFLYSLFSVVWAFWQLYRNVDIIQHVLEPIIAVLKEVYLASIIEVFDWLLAIFTEFWMRFLSPLNILTASDETDTAASVGKVASDPQEDNITGSIRVNVSRTNKMEHFI